MTKRQPQKSLEGRRVRLIRCHDPYVHLDDGLEGVVTLVDDAGTVHVDWEDGKKLGLVWEDGDRWQVLITKP